MEKLPPIKDEQEYEKVVDEIRDLFNAKPGSKEIERLGALVEIGQAYAKEHHPIDPPSKTTQVRTRDLKFFLLGFMASTIIDLILLLLHAK